jgi:hypothetical protein
MIAAGEVWGIKKRTTTNNTRTPLGLPGIDWVDLERRHVTQQRQHHLSIIATHTSPNNMAARLLNRMSPMEEAQQQINASTAATGQAATGGA